MRGSVTPIAESVAMLVATLRHRDGRTLREVAAEIGCAHSHLYDIERGMRLPSAELALRIADEYGYDAAMMAVTWVADRTSMAADEMTKAQRLRGRS